MILELSENYKTKTRGENGAEYEIYLTFADNGKGLDITNNLMPLLSYNEWLNK